MISGAKPKSSSHSFLSELARSTSEVATKEAGPTGTDIEAPELLLPKLPIPELNPLATSLMFQSRNYCLRC
ncbi:hypothetical protein BZL30_1235 [Mycobacterium kansasii]|uniref:Uncharacterized protein n=1 Tax=Mycobacterium kansasii TaxID=1768 RepID=A0A1V3XST2_MYCKA|nr:hypothetical protein BZL30_1235 [Mycobacterium kansasii]